MLAAGAPVLAIAMRVRDVLGVYSGGGTGFELWPSFADKPGSASFHTPHRERVEGLAAPHWAPEFDWTRGGLEGRGGLALFLAA